MHMFIYPAHSKYAYSFVKLLAIEEPTWVYAYSYFRYSITSYEYF